LRTVLEQNGDVITSSQANANGVSNERLRLLEKSGELERVAHGIYILPENFPDMMYVTQLAISKIVYSHETALYLHDLTDRDPLRYAVTVPASYNSKMLRKLGIEIHTVRPEFHKMGVVKLTNMFGNEVVAYGPERTVCDCIRSRNKMDAYIFADALKRYAKRSDKNLPLLMEYAARFKVRKILQPYLEVLL
jgi:predicted transcriptional regulator of viral defense system